MLILALISACLQAFLSPAAWQQLNMTKYLPAQACTTDLIFSGHTNTHLHTDVFQSWIVISTKGFSHPLFFFSLIYIIAVPLVTSSTLHVNEMSLSLRRFPLLCRYAVAGYNMLKGSKPQLSGLCMHVIFSEGAHSDSMLCVRVWPHILCVTCTLGQIKSDSEWVWGIQRCFSHRGPYPFVPYDSTQGFF